ncbi:hypothetical protein [Mesoplasma seiffertii]|uniref:hypothetical protein n=1 Tax=Mesoplasma seiffertii TaxID=28224 RepID=UPI00047901DF|nr:hypothetical protein [Mesoplasma seiffertii]
MPIFRSIKYFYCFFYSSRKNFSGGYLWSVPADLVWSNLIAYKYGTNGFHRFQLDEFTTNDIYLDGYIAKNEHEPMDSALIYSGDKQKNMTVCEF